jgi:chromosomal replication initiation ATPase DnaA
MAERRQLVLDLPHRTAFGRDDFFVTPCNQEALAFIDRWPNWPAPLAVLCGPPGCGKSHLAAVWQEQIGAISLDQSDFQSVISRIGPTECCFVVDLVDGIADEEAFFHLYNRVAEQSGGILATAPSPPARWTFNLADLESRLRAAPVLNIGRADDELLEAVLIKLFADRQLRVEAGVVGYLLRRMDRSLGAARNLVADLDNAALAEHRTISVPFARSILEASQPC